MMTTSTDKPVPHMEDDNDTTGSQDADGSDKDDIGRPVPARSQRQRRREANATRGKRRRQ